MTLFRSNQCNTDSRLEKTNTDEREGAAYDLALTMASHDVADNGARESIARVAQPFTVEFPAPLSWIHSPSQLKVGTSAYWQIV